MGELPDTWGLPQGYSSRWPVEYYSDSPSAVRLQTWQRAVYDAATAALQSLNAPLLVDVGCGSGEKTVRATRGRFIGIDFGSNIKSARKSHPSGDWRESDFDSDDLLPLEPGEMGRVVLVCADVVEHLERPDRLLKSIRAALGKEGVAIVSTPDRALTAGSGHPGPPGNGAHVREWTALEFIELLRSVGFSHGLITWTAPHDLAVEATSITAFLSNSPESLGALQITNADVHGFVVSPPCQPGPVVTLERVTAQVRRQARRVQLRLLGQRRSA